MRKRIYYAMIVGLEVLVIAQAFAIYQFSRRLGHYKDQIMLIQQDRSSLTDSYGQCLDTLDAVVAQCSQQDQGQDNQKL